MVTITTTALSQSGVSTLQNGDIYSQTDFNTTVSNIRTKINSIVVDLNALNAGEGALASNNTWTGTNAFQANATFYNVYFTSTYGFGDQFILLDAANASAERDQSIRFNRGSTSATPARITYDATNHLYRFSTDNDTTLAKIRHLDGAASTDGMSYGQGVKATGTVTENITGTKTFTTTLPLCATVPTTDTQLINKLYADTQYASVSAGGILQQSSTPAITANTLWIDTTTVANLKFLRANGTVYAPITGIHQGTSAPTSPTPASGHLWIDTTSTTQASLKRYDGSAWKQVLPATVDTATTFTGVVTFSATPVFSTTSTFTGAATFNGGWAAGSAVTLNANSNKITNVTDCTAAQDAATKNYVDNNNKYKLLFNQTASVTVTAASATTIVSTGSGTATIAANTLAVGDVIKVTATGTVTGGVGSARTVSFVLPYSGGASVSIACADTQPATVWRIERIMAVKSIGSGGTLFGATTCLQMVASAAGVNTGQVDSGDVAINTTNANALTMTAAWDATTNNPTVTCNGLILERYSV